MVVSCCRVVVGVSILDVTMLICVCDDDDDVFVFRIMLVDLFRSMRRVCNVECRWAQVLCRKAQVPVAGFLFMYSITILSVVRYLFKNVLLIICVFT